MSVAASPRRILHLAVGDFPVSRLEEIKKASDAVDSVTEIFVLTETNAREAVEKIFSAHGVTVWGAVL